MCIRSRGHILEPPGCRPGRLRRVSLGSDAFKKKLWTDRDYLMAIGYSTPYANLAGDTAAEYYVDLPGLFSTSTAPNILEIVNEAIRSRGMEELSQNRRAIQQYVAEAVSYTHLRAHETVLDLVCRLLLEKKKNTTNNSEQTSKT